MKVCILVINSFTNDSRVHKTASSLGRAGYEVTVVALWKPEVNQFEEKKDYRVLRIKLISRKLKNRLISIPIKYLEFAFRVWQLAGKEHFKIYHANDANTLPAAWLASKRNSGKIIYDSHELETGRNFSGSIPYIYRLLWSLPEKIFIHRVHSRITVNPLIADELTRIYKIEKPIIIYNYPEKFIAKKTYLVHDKLNIPRNYKILLYQGLVARGRGIEIFIKAVNILQDVVGVVLGEGPELETFRKQINLSGLKRFYFPGRVPLDILPLYTASADIGIVLIQGTSMSYRLSLPNKLFEYIQAGIPVICTNLPSLAQIVNEYRIGLLVDIENLDSIIHNIRILLDNQNIYAEMRNNELKAAEIFNWENESKKLLEIYNTVH